ncbi:MAG TPA: hypothetical protein VK735_13060 [Pseudonocardia sp.]|uniref:DUF6886 family protein n=1 Tax=Pseudonocardia sp. TaxID=60912 RepID=UPI002C1E3706|nr:DUF6886 family protein [Pseudonocardia sp.]HTF48373.1 hypothetical protein [Pseudonocardia sp.]
MATLSTPPTTPSPNPPLPTSRPTTTALTLHTEHAIEYDWLDRIQTARLFAYRLPARRFKPFGTPIPNAHVATEPIEPLGPPEPVGNLLMLHEKAEIQLRVLNNLWPF